MTSCNDDEENDNGGKETPVHTGLSRVVLVYMVAENNLSGMATTDIREMLGGCAQMSDNDRLIIYLDNAVKSKAPALYEITNKTEEKTLSALTPVRTCSEEYNSASAETLDMVMKHVYDNYRAENYGIVFWSHASGWTPSSYDSPAGTNVRMPLCTSFGVDTGNNNASSAWGEQMGIDEMATVLKKYHSIDFLLFDACFMQAIEAAYELKDVTRYIMASPAEIPGPGAPYNMMIKPMFADQFDITAVMDAYYTYYYNDLDYGVLLSVIDCAELENFADVHSRIFHKYKGNMEYVNFSEILNYFDFDRWHRSTDIPDCYDMKGVMMQLVTNPDDMDIWLKAFNKAVPYSCMTDKWYTDYARTYMYVDEEQYSGVTMYVEQDKYKGHFFYNAYPQTAWAKAIGL